MRTGITKMPEKGYNLTQLTNGEVQITLYRNPIEEYDSDNNLHITANVLSFRRRNFDGLAQSVEDNYEWYWQQGEQEQTEKLTAQFTKAVQKWMDAKAQERGYDNIISACTYVYSSDAVFAKEGAAAKEWRDKVWRYCYDVVAQVVSGSRSIPSTSELLAELPKLEW
ncbi:hypothetical protein [uncultured Phascolarctobacterium sp.]|uniref:hypothetical protein n=1 Tax=uncultured Phascolarctobacterium sp. TaxID=512296 RepID=UPI0025DD29FD|nr:hypothetical protein [uncultured Phascolarctobacterium sp.]